jgi:hypothetical protein
MAVKGSLIALGTYSLISVGSIAFWVFANPKL